MQEILSLPETTNNKLFVIIVLVTMMCVYKVNNDFPSTNLFLLKVVSGRVDT